jgi:murein DD-endopeptidase MepM/ murein hydrolase activator NlpD
LRYVSLIGSAVGVSSVLFFPSAAIADAGQTGGAVMPEEPIVRTVACSDGRTWACQPRQQLIVRGEDLRRVRSVTFLGRRGRGDDRTQRPRSTGQHAVGLVVPATAQTGPLLVRTRYAGKARTRRAVQIAASSSAPPTAEAILAGGERPATFRYRAPASASQDTTVEAVRIEDGAVVRRWPLAVGPDGTGEVAWDGTVKGIPQPPGRYAFRTVGGSTAEVSADAGSDTEFSLVDAIFPIRGEHDLGQSAANGFGGARGHKGQDMFAACGTPLVAAQAGRVVAAKYHSAAGYYVVIKRPDGQSHAYMHMLGTALVSEGDRVKAGQAIGSVGQSGRASGCHLHFELWTAPGWYSGGQAVDPLPTLQAWDAMS